MSHMFSCDKSKSEDSLIRFQRVFKPIHSELNEITEICIGKHVYQKHVIIEEIDVAIRIAQTEWYNLQSIILYENILPFTEASYSRDVVNATFLTFLESLQLCSCPEQKSRYVSSIVKALDNFSNSVVPLVKFQDEVLVKISTSAMNDTKCPIYQYFHSFLDIQYHLLALLYICETPQEKFESRIKSVMKDLVTVIKKNYRRQSSQNRQSFLCNCVRKFWLILQLFTEKISSDKDWFWKIFNEVLENEDPLFSLWLLKDIASLQSVNASFEEEGNRSDRITPNYTLLENKLKVLLPNASSETYLECFRIIEPLLSGLWLNKARIEVFQIIWDHYSKRLNISNKKPPQKAVQFNEIIDSILRSPKDCNEDFEVFVGILIVHLKEYPSHWGKMKGRIYSQLGPNKVKDLNEIGVTHVMMLFLCLASVNFSELSKKVISFVENLPFEKRNTTYIWNSYTVFVFRHVSEGHDLETAAPVMLQMLDNAASDPKQFRLIKDFVENFKHVINYSVNYQLHQWLFLDKWLLKYLSTCYYADLKTALEVLLYCFEKVGDADSWPLWEPAFKNYIYPCLKQVGNTATTPEAVGKIGGKLCILVPSLTNDAFNFFNNEAVHPRVACEFLNVVLTDFPNGFMLSPSQESLVLQSWVKICLLTTDLCEDLTVNVVKLDCFPVALKEHIVTSRDPIYALIEYLGSDIKQHLHSSSVTKLCESCFGHVDKWIGSFLTQPEDETVVFRIYTCVSLAFLHCGQLLYDRNKSTSPLMKLVQALLLPTDFLIGKKVLHTFVLGAVKKTWHIFYEAIVKLNSDVDAFLERTLRDLLLKYVQYFSTADSPIIKCLENASTAPIILDKISSFYFKHPARESDANTLKVLRILGDFVRSTTSLTVMKLIVNKCLYGLFEIVIFHAQRNAALSVVKALTGSPLYPQVKEDFKRVTLAFTERHLAFNTVNYFQLMGVLVKFVPADMKSILSNVKQHISNVEKMRGVGFDNNLRTQFEKLENSLNC